MSPSEGSEGTLAARLSARSEASAAQRPAGARNVHAEGIETVERSGVAANALGVGDAAPSFVLPDAMGRQVRLSELLARGPVVMVWYRGGWCPYCNIQLQAMQEVLPELEAAGGTLVAISPERPDESMSTKEQNELDFVVLSDLGNRAAAAYGLAFTLPGPVAEAYQKGFDLHRHNMDTSNRLPLAATYVVDQDGVISWAQVDADYRKRAEPAEIVAHLRSMD